MKKNILAIVLLCSIAVPAFADNTGKYYMAVDLGKASLSNVTIATGVTFPNPGMIRIAGGYHFSPMLAAEVGYSKFGDSTLDFGGSQATLAMSSFHVAAVGTYPLNPQFDLIGKLGLSSNSAKLTGTGALAGINSTDSKTDLLIGFGAQYNINEQASIRAQYESFGAMDSSSTPIKATAFSLGYVHNF